MLLYYIWFWGSFLQGLQWWCSHGVFVQLMWTRCDHLIQNQSVLSACSFSTSVHFERLIICSFLVLFHVICNHLSSKSAPEHIVICKVAGFQLLLHLPCVKFTDTAPSPESMFYFQHWLTYVNCFDWSCHIAMLLTSKLRLRPKPLIVNKCIWSWWRVVITFI